MRKFFLSLGFAALATISSAAAFGAPLSKEAIPAAVLQALMKDHPKAEDISAVVKKHFGQELYMLTFKELTKEKEPVDTEANEQAAPVYKDVVEERIEIYRKNGSFFVSAERVDNANRMSVLAYENLKKAFPSYTIEKAVMVINPNGPGEEFDLIINSAGEKWAVTIDRKSEVALKEKE